MRFGTTSVRRPNLHHRLQWYDPRSATVALAYRQKLLDSPGVVACAYAMHELSIAIDLVELACEKVSSRHDARVAVIHLRVGALAGVVKEALLFSFEAAAAGTAVSGARLQIEDVPVTVWCPKCATSRELMRISHRRCPVCEGVTPTIVGGDALELVGLELAG